LGKSLWIPLILGRNFSFKSVKEDLNLTIYFYIRVQTFRNLLRKYPSVDIGILDRLKTICRNEGEDLDKETLEGLMRSSDNIKDKYKKLNDKLNEEAFPIICLLGGPSLTNEVRHFTACFSKRMCEIMTEKGTICGPGNRGVSYVSFNQALKDLGETLFTSKVFSIAPHGIQPDFINIPPERLGRTYLQRDVGMIMYLAELLVFIRGKDFYEGKRIQSIEDADRTRSQLDIAFMCQTQAPMVLFEDSGGATELYVKHLEKMGYLHDATVRDRIKIVKGLGSQSIEEAISFIKEEYDYQNA